MKFRHAFLTAAAALSLTACTAHAEEPVRTPIASVKADEGSGLKTAVFAGGCFWGVEGVFSHVKGVTSAVSGYHGGKASGATYDKVSAGMTNHAEAVKVTYDPAIVRYDELLRIYFGVVADPTQLNRQGPDRGRHYRSALVPQNAQQAKVARAYIAQLKKAGLWDRPIVTRIENAGKFYPAESYHQDFAHKNPSHPYIQRWDAPKIRNLKALFPSAYRAAFKTG